MRALVLIAAIVMAGCIDVAYGAIINPGTPGGVADAGPTCTTMHRFLRTYGDSITACVNGLCNTVDLEDGPYPNWLAIRSGMEFTNKAVSGNFAADQIDATTSVSVVGGMTSTIMIGTNDQRTYCTSAAKLDVFKAALRSMIAWTAIVDTARVKGATTGTNTNRVAARTGTWVTGAYGVGEYIAAASGARTMTLNGTTVYVESLLQKDSTATYQIKIDGADAGLFSVQAAGNADFTTTGNRAYTGRLLRFPNLSAGDHTVVLQVVSGAADQANWFDWASGNGWVDRCARPKVIVSTILPQLPNGYDGGGGGGCTQANVNTYNAAIAAIVAEFAADGLNVVLVDSHAAFINDAGTGAKSNLMTDDLHPNAAGHQAIADLFMREIEKQ